MIRERLIELIHDLARYNPEIEHRPFCLLWLDGDFHLMMEQVESGQKYNIIFAR